MISSEGSKLMRKAKSAGVVCLIVMLGAAWLSGCSSSQSTDVYQPADVAAANSGDAAAQDRLLAAANQGNPEAQRNLASMFIRSTAQTYADAANEYRKDAELGHAWARRRLRHECAQAAHWLRQVGDQGSSDAQSQSALRNLYAACPRVSVSQMASTELQPESAPVEVAASDDASTGAEKTSGAEQIASTAKPEAEGSKSNAAVPPIHDVGAAPSDRASTGAAKTSGTEQVASTAKHAAEGSRSNAAASPIHDVGATPSDTASAGAAKTSGAEEVGSSTKRAAQNSKPKVAAPPIHDRRVALVIGNSHYIYVPQLGNPRDDAQLMAATLSREGFELVDGKALLDLDKTSLEQALQKFGDRIQKLQRSGPTVALFYYAGHGIQINGQNYLVPVSADPNKASDAPLQMVQADAAVSEMDDGGARLKIMILDACRNNPFRGISRGIGGGLAEPQAISPGGTLIAYATSPNRTAQDGDGHDSPYSEALAEVIKEPGLDLFDTFNQVDLNVKQTTHNEQQPWFESSPIEGKFCFAGCNN